MKTLYVSDLDGTLLQPDARLSAETVGMLNRAIDGGKLFTVATARTPATVAGILRDVNMRIPAVVMTGASLWDTKTGHYSRMRHLPVEGARELLDVYLASETSTFVYTLDHDMIDIYHIGGEITSLQEEFIAERINSPYKRMHLEGVVDGKFAGDISRVILLYTMLPDAKAQSTFEATKGIPGIRPQYYHDIYGPEVGILEAFSSEATKAKAMRALAAQVGADRIVAFGDNVNDLPMMREADVAVAVENALPEVREAADIVIGPNTDNSVARFILDDRG